MANNLKSHSVIMDKNQTWKVVGDSTREQLWLHVITEKPYEAAFCPTGEDPTPHWILQEGDSMGTHINHFGDVFIRDVDKDGTALNTLSDVLTEIVQVV